MAIFSMFSTYMHVYRPKTHKVKKSILDETENVSKPNEVTKPTYCGVNEVAEIVFTP